MRILFLILTLSSVSKALDPKSVKVKLYGVWMSKSEYCTLPITVFNSSDANFLDFIGKPSLGSLDNTDNKSNGTYKCVILKISETIKFAPKSTVGYCTANQEYTQKLCGAGLSTTDPESLANTPCSAADTSEDTVFMYLSTASTAATVGTSANPFVPPTASQTNLGLTLSAPWYINGSFSTDFLVDASNRLVSSGTTCIIDTPLFSFVQSTD